LHPLIPLKYVRNVISRNTVILCMWVICWLITIISRSCYHTCIYLRSSFPYDTHCRIWFVCITCLSFLCMCLYYTNAQFRLSVLHGSYIYFHFRWCFRYIYSTSTVAQTIFLVKFLYRISDALGDMKQESGLFVHLSFINLSADFCRWIRTLRVICYVALFLTFNHLLSRRCLLKVTKSSLRELSLLTVVILQLVHKLRSKAWTTCARSNSGIVGSNSIRSMDVCMRLLCVCGVLCVGSGLAAGLIPHPRSPTDCV
jgi:hypothetical protein